jgi:hypothetical protein
VNEKNRKTNEVIRLEGGLGIGTILHYIVPQKVGFLGNRWGDKKTLLG